MNFADLNLRLTNYLRDSVRSGELTERGLARATGISQPHIHHVLKGKRTLSTDLADAILHKLHLDLKDFLREE
jgi:plasmid maintenance system antidote protein VapI